MDARRVHETVDLLIPAQAEACVDLVDPALEQAKHADGIVFIHRLAQHMIVQCHRGVRGQHPTPSMATRNHLRLGFGEASHHVRGGLVQEGRLIHIRHLLFEGDAQGLQPLDAARASAGQDERTVDERVVERVVEGHGFPFAKLKSAPPMRAITSRRSAHGLRAGVFTGRQSSRNA